MLPGRKLIWTPRKTARAQDSSLLFKKKKKAKEKKRHQQSTLSQQGGRVGRGGGVATAAKREGFDGYQWRALECLEEDGRDRGHG